jgi:ParB family transcriptional regulator, chromosome partitioning protein
VDSLPTGFISTITSTINSQEIVMTYIQCTPEQPQLIAVNRLEKSPLNARRTVAKIGMDELKASLLAHGLMQNLVVTDKCDGMYRVIAGGRRLEAIHSLQAEGKLPEDFAVPCQIVTEQHAREMSLAENTVRLAMHPADQFEAFAALIDQGESASDVAVRFGVEESFVLKRMKLARVAPELLAEHRADAMSLECLMAYTITDDHRRQMKVFNSLQGWQKEKPKEIRSALTEKMVESSDKLARFVGLEVYRDAGGSTRADLFGNEVFLEKPALLQKLAEEKLGSIRKELQREGWDWVEINPERNYDAIHRCGRLKPQLMEVPAELVDLKSKLDAELEEVEEALEDTESDALLDQQQAIYDRLEEVEQKLAGYIGYDATQKALAGCFVSIGHDGSLFLDKGLVKPEHRKLLAKLLGEDDGRPVKAKPKHTLPESLRKDLAADRLEVAQVAIARNPEIALDLLTFRTASILLGKRSVLDGPDVEFRRPKPGKERESTTARRDLAEIGKALPTAWLKRATEAEQFDAFRSLPQDDRLRLLAYCTALTLEPKLGPAQGEETTAYDAALSLTATRVGDCWRPTKSNFLARINREQLLAISRDVLGEQWSQARRNDKKSSLVDELDRAFAHPEKSGRTPEQEAKLKSWLPQGMSFDIAAAPKPAKARKGRKAA